MAFLNHVRVKMDRDYILIIDRSGSMAGARWAAAREAVNALARGICEFDADGVTVILFSSDVRKFNNVTNAVEVESLFNGNAPSGSTNLSAALDAAFQEHFNGTRGETSILVVTDGSPNSESDVQTVIENAANSIGFDHELSISFIQIGDDRAATRFLEKLDDRLETRFDIVDTMKATEMHDINFVDMIKRSLLD